MENSENSELKRPEDTPMYRVMVDDNFHYMDESERYTLGEFKTLDMRPQSPPDASSLIATSTTS
jgi:hypothetical protein